MLVRDVALNMTLQEQRGPVPLYMCDTSQVLVPSKVIKNHTHPTASC